MEWVWSIGILGVIYTYVMPAAFKFASGILPSSISGNLPAAPTAPSSLMGGVWTVAISGGILAGAVYFAESFLHKKVE